jgi:hypothetical protein
MTMLAVDSSALEAIDYHHGILEIVFESGHLYRYFGVPRHIFEGLRDADSKGLYFHDHIRDRYRFERVD